MGISRTFRALMGTLHCVWHRAWRRLHCRATTGCSPPYIVFQVHLEGPPSAKHSYHKGVEVLSRAQAGRTTSARETDRPIKFPKWGQSERRLCPLSRDDYHAELDRLPGRSARETLARLARESLPRGSHGTSRTLRPGDSCTPRERKPATRSPRDLPAAAPGRVSLASQAEPTTREPRDLPAAERGIL